MKNCLTMKLTISLKACTKMASNYIMAQNLKLLNSLTQQLLCYHITQEVSLISYLNLTPYLKVILLKTLTKWLRVSSKPIKIRRNWTNICLWNCSNFTRLKLWYRHYQNYKNTSQQITRSPSSCSESEAQVLVRPCEAEEADEHVVRHTLNLINNGCRNIVVCTIHTDVLVLLISCIRQVELNNIEICAYLIKLGQVLQHQTDHTRTWFWYFSFFTPLCCFHRMWYCFHFLC